MFGWLKKHRKFGDAEKAALVDAIAGVLEIQLIPTGGRTIEGADGRINPKALGYIYGFIDAALRVAGQDMSATSVGIPITYQVLRSLFPGKEERYASYLAEHMGKDPMVMLGALKGGQQYVDWTNKKLDAPMGLGRFILEQDANAMDAQSDEGC